MIIIPVRPADRKRADENPDKLMKTQSCAADAGLERWRGRWAEQEL